ncbi:MAG: sigma-54 interaction domain-containing protein [Peptococcaceae bacterium]
MKNITLLDDIWANRNLIEAIINNTMDPIVVVNKNGRIVLINEPYRKFLNIEEKEVIGKHVTQIIENTRMHIVIKTGVSEVGDIQRINGHNTVCKRIPIREDGQVVGAVGLMMFRDVKELQVLSDQLGQLERELEYYKGRLQKREKYYTFADIIGEGPYMKEQKNKAQLVAKTNSTILIRGESGTGKEMFAQAIHNSSYKAKNKFIKVNCAAIPEHLLESELFGYEEGAFTGAKKGGKIGKFELANKGTIFLDEIGDMPLNMQVKLLRVLQEKEIEKVGGTGPLSVDTRIIAATNRPLEKYIKEGKFRMDLYYRLNVIELKLLPLREHKEDLPVLVDYLLGTIAERLNKIKPQITKPALQLIHEYAWPGNIRELANVLERAIIFAQEGVVDVEQLNIKADKGMGNEDYSEKGFSLKENLEQAERRIINKALAFTKGNRLKAARLLKISRSQLYKKLEKFKETLS